MAKQTETAEGKRTRAKAEYDVEVQWQAAQTNGVPATCLRNTAAAVRWIRANGEPGKTYRVVRVCAGPLTVTVEKVEKRTLA